MIALKDAGLLHPFSSGTAISNLAGVEVGFASVFIWNYALTSPLQRSASSICLGVFGGEEVGTADLSEGCFVSTPLEMIIHIWSYYPTDLLSNVTLPLATWLCSVSHKSCLTMLSAEGCACSNNALSAA